MLSLEEPILEAQKNMKLSKQMVTIVALAVTNLAASAESAHPHHGADGQKHPMADHRHAGELVGNALDLWEGIATRAGEQGLSLAGEYIYEYTYVLDGGVRTGGSDRNLFVLDAELDLEKLIGLKGATVFAQFQHASRERGGSMDTGDIQGFSNLEVEREMDALYELWFQQIFADGKLRLKVGKVDANTEFNYVDAAGGFAHSSAGFSPTIFTFPTYPDPAMGVNVFATVMENAGNALTLGYGFYDGAAAVDGVETGRRGASTFLSDEKSNDYFHVLQAEQTWDSLGSLGDGRLSVGGWYHSGRFETFSGGSDAGAFGFFITAEQRLTKRSADSEGGIFVFGQYGSAGEDVSEIAQHIAVGVVTQGTFAGRESDSAGLYVSYADLSDDSAAGFQKNECSLDAYYSVSLSEHLSVQPELHYILNPSGSADVSDALVAGVRVSVAF